MAFRVSPSNWPRLAALAVIALLAAALLRRRYRLGFFLVHAAVAAGEVWSDRRARRRVAKVLTARASSGMGAKPDLVAGSV